MTPQQWQRVKSVLAEALERKREEQSAFLDRACSADAWLRAQVEMLPSSGDRSSVLQSAALQMRLKPGTKLGEYGVWGKSIERMTDGWGERWQSRYCPRPCLGTSNGCTGSIRKRERLPP